MYSYFDDIKKLFENHVKEQPLVLNEHEHDISKSFDTNDRYSFVYIKCQLKVRSVNGYEFHYKEKIITCNENMIKNIIK